jgi:hypothetical protein
MKRYKNLITGGCSFTSNGIGGAPPTNTSQGGCSYIDDIDGIVGGGGKKYLASTPGTWAGFLAQKLNVISLINVACQSHGNILTANSILEILNKFNYDPEDTLIVFNLTDPARLDIPCDTTSLVRSNNISWTDNDTIDHGYMSTPKTIKLVKTIGIDAVEKFTSNIVELLFNMLEHRKFEFYFLMMNDYTRHLYLGSIIDKYKTRSITIDPGTGMMEFCQLTNNYISTVDEHPNTNGHKLIADIVYKHINDL